MRHRPITRDQARDMSEAHAEGHHAELPREGCPECDGRDLRSYPQRVCLDYGKTPCEGEVELRHPLSSTGVSFPRCEKHWGERLDEQQRIDERYPQTAPSDFDPLYAGERWDEE